LSLGAAALQNQLGAKNESTPIALNNHEEFSLAATRHLDLDLPSAWMRSFG
jgi:hypothetical protein